MDDDKTESENLDSTALFPEDADRLAYWMNAYNALMLHRVVDTWPVKSVRAIRVASGVFWMEKHQLGGEGWTLRGLENKIIRERFGDPRVHFAINCASVGCPRLPQRAWTGEGLDAALDATARQFIGAERNVRIDRARATIHLSSIFKWFDSDFTEWLDRTGHAGDNGVVDYVFRYLPETVTRGLNPSELKIEWIDYDWSINAQP